MPPGPSLDPGAPVRPEVRLRDARVRWTGRAEGDLRPAVEPPDRSPRWAGVVDAPVSWLHQVHGAGVVVVTGSGPVRGEDGDALVTAAPGNALAVLTADCAPVALASAEGVVAAVHAGWGGLLEGVVEAAVAAMRRLGATDIDAALGPCIHPGCYEFAGPELEHVVARLGPSVRSTTSWGTPALDLPAAVRAAVDRAGASLVHDEASCTACAGDRSFSHRARREAERQAMVVWRPA